MTSGLQLCSRALIRIGCSTISSFEEGTAEAEVAGQLYPLARDALLSAHPWSFATGHASLAKINAQPVADFEMVYQLPPDFLRALSLGSGGSSRGAPYRIQENRIHTDADPAILAYVFRPDETGLPPYFQQALISRLSAEFCLPLTENTSRAQLEYQLAESELRRARLTDSQQQTPAAIESFPLIEVR